VQELLLESEEVPQDRQMLAKYAVAWNECALAFKDRERWAEAAEAFHNAIRLYGRLQAKA
jgi:tetratricopeptide (TPR) repeat protein